ncbi:cupredoxin domain-containing protein [Marinobacterium sedimentorum]|uniref:cupredoxin domain-containing protein n=1 Tax=Marinobacterium sedimentorum TaxID=2927804 RepID=UPI0020C65ABC|nr:cupredoxin domain-containing protein [Marinobacterium sedimentorum]MCP8690004.1 cupredoxin domain-containing protein [Marinobacterium sedimentorum]
MFSIRPLVAAFCLSALAPLAMAGGSHGSHGDEATPNIGQPGVAAQATRTVSITLYDNYYEVDALDVKAGETLHFELKNEGALLHEFNIGTAPMHKNHQREMRKMVASGMMTETGMVEMDHSNMPGMEDMKHDDPNSILLAPGESGELTWTFSGDAELEFACNMPGHYQAGMVGEFSSN